MLILDTIPSCYLAIYACLLPALWRLKVDVKIESETSRSHVPILSIYLHRNLPHLSKAFLGAANLISHHRVSFRLSYLLRVYSLQFTVHVYSTWVRS